MTSLLRVGLTAVRARFGLWGWLYVAKLCLALVFTLPVLAVISVWLDYSTFAMPLLKIWSIDVIGELIGTRTDLVPAFVAVLLFYSLAVFFVGQFLSGGIQATFLSGNELGPRGFFAESAGLFSTNLKASLVMFLPYLVLLLIWGTVTAPLPQDVLGHFGLAAFGGIAIHVASLYVLLIFSSIFSQVLRLHLAAEPTVPVLKVVRPAIDFYLHRAVKLNGVYYLYFVPFVLVWLLVEYLSAKLTGTLGSLIGVMVEMFLFQICSWLRTGQSLAFTATLAPLVRDAYPGRFGPNKGDRLGD
jgi:hypothetical protein